MPDKNKKPNSENAREPSTSGTQIFADPESRRNLIGLFELLYKIDRRINPQFYAVEDKNKGQETMQ